MGRVKLDGVKTRNSTVFLSVIKVRPAYVMDLTRNQAEPPPQIRFILLLPTVHERIAEELFFKQAEADVIKTKKKTQRRGEVEPDPEKMAEIHLQIEKTKEVLKKNELYDENAKDPADTLSLEGWKEDRFNISRDALLKVMTRYDLAPGACSHIRGQEQIFGARTLKNEMNEVTAVGKSYVWFATLCSWEYQT
jgi:hypothetical protein